MSGFAYIYLTLLQQRPMYVKLCYNILCITVVILFTTHNWKTISRIWGERCLYVIYLDLGSDESLQLIMTRL